MFNRLIFLALIFSFAYGVLIFRLYDLQVRRGETYLVRAESQYAAANFLKAERGRIYLRDKQDKQLPVATLKNFPLVYAVPKAIADPKETVNWLAPLLEMTPEELEKKIFQGSESYRLLKRKVAAEVAAQIEEAGIRGIYVEQVPERFYPFGKMAAHLLGFVAPSDKDAGEVGRYGVEEFYEETLRGRPGRLEGARIVPPQPGEEVVLTIDPNIQREAERVLGDLVKDYAAIGGSVIVAEPHTGKVLAMASLPTFDPNFYSGYELGRFINPVTQKIYEPGSVFKVITMAAGIDAGRITPETTYEDSGRVVVSGRVIENWDKKAHGKVTMTEVIEGSINTGAVFAQRQIGKAVFREYLERFGLGEKTGIDLPGEVRGNLRRLTSAAPEVAFATASFGQGVAVTPLELLAAVSAIANGGKLMRPYIGADRSPEVVRQVISPATARQVTAMMVKAVDKAGVAKIKGYSIAGKTGTAQVPDTKGGYSNKVINTYVGFGPATDPRFIILLKLDEPEGTPLAGVTVVPAFRELAQFILNYYHLPPDRLEE